MGAVGFDELLTGPWRRAHDRQPLRLSDLVLAEIETFADHDLSCRCFIRLASQVPQRRSHDETSRLNPEELHCRTGVQVYLDFRGRVDTCRIGQSTTPAGESQQQPHDNQSPT